MLNTEDGYISLVADYVLEYRNTKLAVIEAKAWDKPLTEGVAQTKEYANKLALRFAAVPFEGKGGFFQLRYYQDIAIERVMAAVADGRERILLTLATGTGKTFIAFQIAWKLFQSRWNLNDAKADGEPRRRPRILFLADRNILANQAYNDFSAFDDKALVRIDPESIRKRGQVPKNGSIFTRLHDGKDYFTIYDFVKAHQHFTDPEWDGEPVEPEPCGRCHSSPCVCKKEPPKPCKECSNSPCTCPKQPCEKCGQRPCVCKKKVKVKLADGKTRQIQYMVATSFWHPDGTPMSAQQFMEELFGRLPDFFSDEEELRALWSAPDTRRKLLEGLAEKGFGKEQLVEMQRLVNAQKSDLFDVLAYVAYAQEPLTRKQRAERAMALISGHFNPKQQIFLDFVLSHYVAQGVEELDQTRLTPLLKLRYQDSIPDAVADLGNPEQIRQVFSGFQRYLYAEVEA